MSPDRPPYNPLDKKNLAVSVVRALLEQPISSLPPSEAFNGAGVYAIYYTGNFAAYKYVTQMNIGGQWNLPIYVGKAVPRGSRKGIVNLEAPVGRVLFNRLYEHAESIRQVSNLRLEDFRCRFLVADDIWIPLGESLLIGKFRPVWNTVVDGFGNHDPGSGRYKGQRPQWDVLHPGRGWAMKCEENSRSETDLIDSITQFFDSERTRNQTSRPPEKIDKDSEVS